MNGKSNDSSFHHPGYIQEDPEKLIEIENINFNGGNKIKTNPDLIPMGEPTFKPYQEVSGLFQEKSPEFPELNYRNGGDVNLNRGERESVNPRKVSLHEEKNRIDDIPKQLTTTQQEEYSSCFKCLFKRQKKFDKIRVYFGPNATQDSIYKHPGNHVRTTK